MGVNTVLSHGLETDRQTDGRTDGRIEGVVNFLPI